MRHDTDPAWYIADLEAELTATKEKFARTEHLLNVANDAIKFTADYVEKMKEKLERAEKVVDQAEWFLENKNGDEKLRKFIKAYRGGGE